METSTYVLYIYIYVFIYIYIYILCIYIYIYCIYIYIFIVYIYICIYLFIYTHTHLLHALVAPRRVDGPQWLTWQTPPARTGLPATAWVVRLCLTVQNDNASFMTMKHDIWGSPWFINWQDVWIDTNHMHQMKLPILAWGSDITD